MKSADNTTARNLNARMVGSLNQSLIHSANVFLRFVATSLYISIVNPWLGIDSNGLVEGDLNSKLPHRYDLWKWRRVWVSPIGK